MSAENPALPREMVLASAGSGKTYYLSSRLIGLLAKGVTPEAVWASTFTRKAAAEILERVLLRLARGALDAHAAQELALGAWLGPGPNPPPDFLNRGHCGRLLSELVFSLHRANIGTLDSFFVQVATTFARELGLSPAWRMVEGPEEDRMRSEGLEAVLNQKDSAVLAELVRIMAKGDVNRGIHGRLFEQVEELLAVQREVGEGVDDAWDLHFPSVGPAGVLSEEEVRKRCHELADAVGGAEAPQNKNGTPNSGWRKELLRLEGVVRSGDWKALFALGLGKKIVESGEVASAGGVVYQRHTPDAYLAPLLDEVVALARADLGRDLTRQAGALERLTKWYQEAFEEAQKGKGRYRFGDITHLLRRSAVLGASDALYFRLDARIQHLLLDEFQDTSLAQWEVLEPVVGELLAGDEGERAAVVVADPKQSIYGWRGARPSLVPFVQDRYGLVQEKLEKSYRSGPVILDTVKATFSNLEENAVVQEMDGGSPVARQWREDLYQQESNDQAQPGFAEIRIGPRTEGRGGVQPALLDYAAQLIGELHAREPRASVGVLVRTNKVVSYIIAALRKLGIPASGEGGTPLTDAAPVNAILALLRLADHPGDRLARYHVAQTPVGEMMGYTNHQEGAEASRLARRIRGQLLRKGYGFTLDRWAKALASSCNALERSRLLQLVELGFRWDGDRTLRPGDFVTLVEKQKVEDPSGARVRVMTVHQSKGLQFDVVVLPHLYPSLEKSGDRGPVVPFRDGSTGQVKKVYPATDKATRTLLPELRAPHEQVRAFRLRDELSALYVAMTRSRYALHMLVPADGPNGPGTTKSPARLLREALAPGEPAEEAGRTLFHHGDPSWFERMEAKDFSGATAADEGAAPIGQETAGIGQLARPVVMKAPLGPRLRNLARRSPSGLEGGEALDLATHLRLDLKGDARRRGTLVHAWCEEVGWLDDTSSGKAPETRGPFDENVLIARARRVVPGLSEPRLREWLADYLTWMKADAIRGALSQAAYPAGARVERELPFLHRVPDGILQGYIDRLVLVENSGRVEAAEVLDFKTDYIDESEPHALDDRVAYYRPQIDAYRTAVASRYGLGLDHISGKLLFLRSGVVREV